MSAGRMHSSYSRWSGVLKSTSAMTKMTVEPVHRHSCANSSALPVQLVCGWPDVPCSGSGSPASRALPPETARKQPSEPPKIDLQGVDSIDEASDWTPRRIPLHPYPTMTQRQSNPSVAQIYSNSYRGLLLSLWIYASTELSFLKLKERMQPRYRTSIERGDSMY